MSDETPEIAELTSQQSIAQIADQINTLEDSILQHVDSAVKEASLEKYGHVAGNLTVQDVGSMLKSHGVKPKLATELARTAITRHERFRWSDTGKKIQSDAEKQTDKE